MSHSLVSRYSPQRKRLSRTDEALAESFELINEFPVAPVLTRTNSGYKEDTGALHPDNISDVTSISNESCLLSVRSMPIANGVNVLKSKSFETMSMAGGLDDYTERSTYKGFISPQRKAEVLNFSIRDFDGNNNVKTMDLNDQNDNPDEITSFSMNDSPRRGPNPLEQASNMKEAFVTEKMRSKKLKVQLKALDQRLSDTNVMVSKLKRLQTKSNKMISKYQKEIDFMTKKVNNVTKENSLLSNDNSILQRKLGETEDAYYVVTKDNERLSGSLDGMIYWSKTNC